LTARCLAHTKQHSTYASSITATQHSKRAAVCCNRRLKLVKPSAARLALR
jgi:hypothetical protein